MNNKHLFLSAEILSRLRFSEPTPGVYYVQSLDSLKPMRAIPEEIVRQLVVLSLTFQYHYPEHRIVLEYPIQMGRTKKRADIIIRGEGAEVDVVVEVKQRIDSDAIEQLKSYVMVTGAKYGLAVSGLEYICLKRDAGSQFVELADLPVFGGVAQASGDAHRALVRPSSTLTLRTALQLEEFERVGQAKVMMRIQGRRLTLSIADLASFVKTRKRFLAEGVILALDVREAMWLSFIRELLSTTPAPVPGNSTRASQNNQWVSKIELWLKSQPRDRNFLSAGMISAEVFGGPAKNIDRQEVRQIANAMRTIGWKSGFKRVDGVMTRGYRRDTKDDPLDVLVREL